MIIKLIQPKMLMRPMDTTLKTRMSPALGLLTIANMLSKDHTVLIENENVKAIDFTQAVDLVGITVTVDVLERAKEIAAAYKKKKIPTVAGGIHITAFPQGVAEYFDVLCIGMAEKTWPDLLKDYENHSLKKIYRFRDQITGSELVSPAYHLIDQSQYLYSNIVSTSRGCPFQCDFCYNSAPACKNLYINRPIQDVIADIKAIGKRHIMFIDDNFIGNPQWTLDFVKAIQGLQLKWNAAVSANIVQMPELLDEMKRSGCQSLFIGFESLNAKAISCIHKKQNQVPQFNKLVEELHKRGIMINASFVFGLDEDDKTTFQTTLNWIIKNKIETVTSHILTPYPGTKVYEDFMAKGRITDCNFSKYNTANVVFQPKNMTEQELYQGYLWVYKKVYSLKNILRRMPKQQKIPYLIFNLFYRKYGKLTAKLCDAFTYERIGHWAEKFSYFFK